MMKTVLRLSKTVLPLVLAAAVLFLTANAEVRDGILLKLAPGHAREAFLSKFSNSEGQEIYLLGTIHNEHLTTEEYSLLHVEAILSHLRPDLVLVESRPEELANDNWGDGPIEMLFASLTARAVGFEVEGMDWWRKEEAGNFLGLFLVTNSEEREDRMMRNILQSLPGHKTTLILTGFGHLAGFRQRLRTAGFAEASLTPKQKQALFDTTSRTLSFPPGMAHYIQKRIEIEQANLQNETDPDWRARIESVIAARQALLEVIATVGER